MVFGIVDNFTNQFQDTTEAFENDDMDEDIYDTGQEQNPMEDEIEDEIKDEIEDEIEGFQDINRIVGEEVTTEEEESFKNTIEAFTNNDTIEGFSGGEQYEYKTSKFILKCILFGLIFFILSHNSTYNLTKPLTKQFSKTVDKHIIHTIIFIIIYYIINMVI